MCGIVGLAGPYSLDTLTKLTSKLVHRGPDDRGLYHTPLPGGDGFLGLGHCRLSIIDLESGQQPMLSQDGNLALVFNGEIYNYRELKAHLASLGHRFRTTSDTEVILAGYSQWGLEMVSRLEGMFAFGLWDAKHGRLLLARDRFGIKPLYYTRPSPRTLAFASELKPLLALSGPKTNPTQFYHYLLYGWTGQGESIFSGLHQLPPGHCASWERGSWKTWRYWRMPRRPIALDAGEAARKLRRRLIQAVESHLVADVTVGMTLSGGLDSSSILAAMAQVQGAEQVKAFTLGFGLPNDELPYSRQAAAHVGVKAHERIIGARQLFRVLPRVAWHLEEPLAHPVAPTTYILAGFVKSRVKVALIGEGSDELFGGYPHYALFAPPFLWAPRRVFASQFFRAAFLLPGARAYARLLNPDVFQAQDLRETAHRYDHYLAGADQAGGALLFELEHELVQNQLARIDRLTMAHGLEARVPFLDRRFAEFAFNLAFDLKKNRGLEKRVLRQAMESSLPPEVVYRPKSGPAGTQGLLPIWSEHLLAPLVAEYLNPKAIRERGWFRPRRLLAYLDMLDRPVIKKHPIWGRRRQKMIYALVMLELWARLFMDNKEEQ